MKGEGGDGRRGRGRLEWRKEGGREGRGGGRREREGSKGQTSS
jgi:hypothetical protein